MTARHARPVTVVKAGTLAYYDALTAGLVPVRVTEVLTPGEGTVIGGHGAAVVTFTVTAKRGGWYPGDVHTASGASVIPRTHVRGMRRMSGPRISSDYRWERS